ncbi:MAG TPA: FliM/FliN family flagellar motor switch protein [Terriglobales bacterium]|nr:FliM/FliN family flagellar motor switch protein [Terriglobales bacterium]
MAGERKLSKNVVHCDLRRCNQLSSDQVATVTTLHESFARRLTSSLGTQLRVALETRLVSVEQLTYREFLGRLPDLTYLASLHVMPIDVRAAVQFDIALVYPIIDLLLGGSGAPSVEPRDLTEIEEQIIETVFHFIVRDLHDTWAPVLDLEFRFQLRQRNLQIQGIMLPDEKILCISFELQLSESTGTFAILLPGVVSSALLRRLSLQGSYSERVPSRESRKRIRERLLDCKFKADLSLSRSPIAVRRLLDLEPGQVLALPRAADESIPLHIAGRAVFSAYPMRRGSHRCARIMDRLWNSSSSMKVSGS